MNQAALKELAALILPDVTKNGEFYENKYPKRNLSEGAEVTRFAPSPTGFIHVGGLYGSLVSSRFAKQSGGTYYLRIEDTDKKREVENGTRDLILALNRFEITFDEGEDLQGNDYGNYGPYKQSQRVDIYRTFVRQLIEKGFAYPCFCSEEELDGIRKGQESKGLRPGYYGEYAICRNLNIEAVKKALEDGKSFVVRLKSPGDSNNTVTIADRIKGEIEMPQNDQDIVLLKSDGIPTYHFAHVVDDHLMRTTTVTRGDEWLSSAPIHFQLFDLLGWEKPKYAHFSTIQKEENGAKRKISKRKDPEASVAFYHESGIPAEALIEYLLNLVNSNFEDWRRDNPGRSNTEFEVRLEKMSVSGSLFDMVKLLNISKNIIGEMTAEKVYDESLKWAKEYDQNLYSLLSDNKEYTLKILNIERGVEKPRKDIAKWSDTGDFLSYFYDSEFEKNIKETGHCFSDKITKNEIRELLKSFLETYSPEDDKDIWFGKLKELAEKFGFSKDVKAYKKSPEQFKGHIGDVAEILRITLANRKNTPDLCEVMNVMGLSRIQKRFSVV
jgi:glutamyl-tRNA synthetase